MNEYKSGKSHKVHRQEVSADDVAGASCSIVERLVEDSRKGPLSFEAKRFLRTHSKNDDPSDQKTQVWQCIFEPKTSNPYKSTGIIATCGGSSICFIRVEDGEVILKYNKDSKKSKLARGDDYLYAMAWTTLPLGEPGRGKQINVLAAGGSRSRVLLLHSEAGVCYDTFCTVPGRSNAVIASLLFHPKSPTWIFCGHEDGHIQIWDIGVPQLPTYTNSSPVMLRTLPNPEGISDAYNLVYSHSHDLLVVGYDGGLHLWNAGVEKIKEEVQLDRTEFLLPDVNDSDFVVDSVCLLNNDLLAVKCALHGYIYIFAISKVMFIRAEKGTERGGGLYESVVSDSFILRLKWSDTDNFYMNMGVDPISCLLVCGDDAGTLWVYDLAAYVTGSESSPLNGGSPIDVLQPTVMLPWPDLEDPEVQKARKQQVTAYDIVIDKCAVSPGGRYIVAVTSNNMVCIWKRERS